MSPGVTKLRSVPTSESTEAATVLDVLTDKIVLVRSGATQLRCRRAFSCVISPQAGDRVLIHQDNEQQLWVTTILERPEVREAHMRVDGHLVIEATGLLCLQGGEELKATGGRRLALQAHRFSLVSEHANVCAGSAQIDSAQVQGRIGTLRLIAKVLETAAEHISQFSKRSFRTVESVEHLRAAHIDHEGTESLRLHGKDAVLTARNLAKIDAAQIHLG